MQENKKFKIVSSKKTRYLLPNILTLAGVCLGISSIKFAIDGNFSLAVTLILFAAILDALDGRIARLIKGTSEFGKELDSLTDFVSFGIAPVFILYFWELSNYGKLGWAITLIYSVCCVLRLARFNLTKIEDTEGWKNTMDSTSNATGNAFMVATGGTETTSGNCKIHTFTGPGTFAVSSIAVNCAANNVVSYMVVGGGGAPYFISVWIWARLVVAGFVRLMAAPSSPLLESFVTLISVG